MSKHLNSVKDRTAPTNPKEVIQFLNLVGYYRELIPHFAGHPRPLNIPTRKDVSFHWTSQCPDAFNLLKQSFLEGPIL